MRILKPEIAKARKEKILRWVVQQFVETRRPVGSQMIADGALQDVSSATIRNIMKELEEEGYLYQPHTSGGRIPTDKAYRYYVDYLASVQHSCVALYALCVREMPIFTFSARTSSENWTTVAIDGEVAGIRYGVYASLGAKADWAKFT